MFEPTITLSKALTEPKLFGKIFAATSFWTWRVVAKVIDGLPLNEPRENELFEQCTGRSYDRQERRAARRLIILAGRRAGKVEHCSYFFGKPGHKLPRCVSCRRASVDQLDQPGILRRPGGIP